MSLLTDFARTSRSRRCPVCGKPDWCLVGRDDPDSPSLAICSRVESRRRWGAAGWLHRLREDAAAPRPRTWTLEFGLGQGPAQHLELARGAFARGAVRRAALARRLGVSDESLRALRVGWLDAGDASGQWIRPPGAWTLPMRDARGAVIGVRLRHPEGARFAVRGSRSGLFFDPEILRRPIERLFIAEGESDTGAGIDLGLSVVGRPSCSGGARLLERLVRALAPASVVVIGDRDEPGERGASDLARILALHARDIRVVVPEEPCADDLRAAVDRSTPLGLRVVIGRGHGR